MSEQNVQDLGAKTMSKHHTERDITVFITMQLPKGGHSIYLFDLFINTNICDFNLGVTSPHFIILFLFFSFFLFFTWCEFEVNLCSLD